MVDEERIVIAGEEDIIVARQRAREVARSLGFGLVDQSRIATAVSELTRNIVLYAVGSRGDVALKPRHDTVRGTGLEIVVADAGPGIPDLEQALHQGFTTSRGMGLGLSGTRRLMDEMEIDTGAGRGTTITIRKWRR